MKTLVVLILLLGFLMGGMVVVKPAEAACGQTIYADRAYSTGGVTYVYGRTSSLATQIYYWNTANAVLANMIFNAVAQRNRLFVLGNATACPTTGTTLFGGTIQYMYQQP